MKKLVNLLPVMIFAAFCISCSVDRTEEGESPELDVDVQAESGELPEYDVDWANVEVATRTKTVMVPKVVIVEEERQVEVPYIDVHTPDDNGQNERREQTVRVEAEVTGESYQLQIVEVYAADDDLIVISELKSTGQDLQGKRMRVSDQLVINAPDMDVEHYIIGERPEGDFNTQHTFVGSRTDLQDEIEDASRIYSRDS